MFDGHGKKVLVVDDEELVLNLVSESLHPTGCELAVAADGEAALRQLRETRFDVTICDWKMPGVNGQQVYEALRTLDRDAASRFIFMTGDVMNSNVQSFLEQTGVTCLAKPFRSITSVSSSARSSRPHKRDHSSAALKLASTLKSSSVVVSPLMVPPEAISFRMRRMILPLRVLGNAAAKRTRVRLCERTDLLADVSSQFFLQRLTRFLAAFQRHKNNQRLAF